MLTVDSIQKKILYAISAFAIVTILIKTLIFANTNYESVRNNIHHQMENIIERDALKVTSFFSQYARVSDTFIHSPEVIDWIVNHTERGSLTGQSEGYQGLNRVLHAVSDRDDNVLSAFYASELTQEYLAEDRITGVPDDDPSTDKDKGYFVRVRPWYNHAIAYKDMLTTAPAVDIITGGISVSVEQVMYHQGELIGAGGIDISLNNIARLTQAIAFEGQGFAALFDDEFKNVSFPTAIHDIKINTPLTDIDKQAGFSGFAALRDQPTQSLVPIEVKGEQYYALTMPVTADMPKMNWRLILFVPIEVVNGPASDAVWGEITSNIITLIVTLAILAFITTIIGKPLKLLTEAFADVAQGDSDLTKTIILQSKDETGRLASHFNVFLQKLRRVVTRVAEDKGQVQVTSNQIEDITKRLILQSEKEKHSFSAITVAATQLAASANEIESNATRTSEAANLMRDKTESAIVIANSASQRMEVLGKQITSVNDIIKELEEASSSIGQVIETINSIAGQTNLLALNAAIEAARAGEQGRGFSVVADEVRNLASRTQDSTKQISAVIVSLQDKINLAGEGINKGMTQTVQVNNEIADSGSSMLEIDALLETIQDDMSQVATASMQQSKAIGEISETMNGVALSADDGAQMVGELGKNAANLHEAVIGLDNQLKQFRY
jgi:methyl-accepting chemotaxis protein